MSKLPTASIKALEVFQAGKWNGDNYSTGDLDAMVSAFARTGFSPIIKCGHQDGQEDPRTAKRLFGEPALGYVEKLYRVGNKLVADIKDIPAKFAALVRAGSYKRISAEIYWGYKTASGETLPRVLKAVSFLGADVPSLTSLKAIESLFAGTGVRVVTYSGVNFSNEKEYSMEHSDFNELFERSQRVGVVDTEAAAAVHQAVQQRVAETKEDYSVALHALRSESKARQYSGDGRIGRPKEDLPARYRSGVALDARAHELVLSRGFSYNQALRYAMDESPADAKGYGYDLERDYGTSKNPIAQLSNIASSYTRENGMMDWVEALAAVSGEVETIQAAAAERIEQLCDRLISVEGVPGSIVNQPGFDYRGECRRRIRNEYPNLARASVDGSALNEQGLRDILWMKR